MAVTLDSYSEANQSEIQNLDSTFIKWGQSFTTPNDGISYSLDSCDIYMKKHTGHAPTGTIYARLYSHSGTYGSTSVGNTLLATSTNNVDASAMSTTFALINFTFDNTLILTPNTNYVIAVTSDDHNADDTDVGFDSTSPSHGGNGMYHAAGAWTEQPTRDLCFYVYGLATESLLSNVILL